MRNHIAKKDTTIQDENAGIIHLIEEARVSKQEQEEYTSSVHIDRGLYNELVKAILAKRGYVRYYVRLEVEAAIRDHIAAMTRQDYKVQEAFK